MKLKNSFATFIFMIFPICISFGQNNFIHELYKEVSDHKLLVDEASITEANEVIGGNSSEYEFHIIIPPVKNLMSSEVKDINVENSNLAVNYSQTFNYWDVYTYRNKVNALSVKYFTNQFPENRKIIALVLHSFTSIKGFHRTERAVKMVQLADFVFGEDVPQSLRDLISNTFIGRNFSYSQTKEENGEYIKMISRILIESVDNYSGGDLWITTSNDFYPGIDDSKLTLHYPTISETCVDCKYKLEIFRKDNTTADYSLEQVPANTVEWNGTCIDNQIVKSSESPIKIKLSLLNSINEVTASNELSLLISPITDEWLDPANGRIKSLVGGDGTYMPISSGHDAITQFQYYLLLRSEIATTLMDNGNSDVLDAYDGSVLDYYTANSIDYSFLGRTYFLHKNYGRSITKLTFNSAFNKSNFSTDNDPYANGGGFNIRNIAGAGDVVSNHSYGMAIDFNPKLNPQISGGSILLYFTQLTGYNFINDNTIARSNGATVMKQKNDALIALHLAESDKQTIVSGMTGLRKAELTTFLTNWNNSTSTASIENQLITEYHRIYGQLYLVNNDRHWFATQDQHDIPNSKAIFNTEVANLDRLLARVIQNKNSSTTTSLYGPSVDYWNNLNKAFLLSKLFPSEWSLVANWQSNCSSITSNYVFSELESAINAIKDYLAVTPIITNNFPQESSLVSQCQSKPNLPQINARINLVLNNLSAAGFADFNNYSTSITGNPDIFGYTLAKRTVYGFNYLDPGFVNTFLNAQYGGYNIFEWGGLYSAKKDFMHIEVIHRDRFKIDFNE